MRKTLAAVFKIRPGEGIKVLQFVALFLLIQAGTAIGITTSDSLFLLNVGAEKLPTVYVLVPLVMLVYVPVNSYLTARFGLGRFFWITLAGLVAGGVTIWWLLGTLEMGGGRAVVLYGAKIYSAVVFIALYSLSWSFTYQYFTILEGKRLFAFFTGGSAVGAIIGGVIINVSTTWMDDVSHLYLVWSVLALLAIPVLSWIISTRKVIEVEGVEEEESIGVIGQTVRLARIIRKSRYVLILLAVLFIAQVLTTLNEFQYLDIFSAAYQDEAKLVDLFAKLYIAVNAFNLFVSTFVFNRMVLRFGVRNVALILPVVYAVVFGWLFIDYGLTAGFFGFFAYQGLMVSVDYDNTNLLLNALPAEAKTQVRTFIEGMAEPLATAAAGLFLLSFGALLDREIISLIGLGGAVVYLILVGVLRHRYVGAMISNLKRTWLDFSRDPEEKVTGLGDHEIAFLKEKAWARDPKLSPTAIGILRLNDPASAADALLDFMSHVDEENREQAELLFSDLLQREDNDQFRRILDWLDRDRARIDTELIQDVIASDLPRNQNLARLLKSPGPRERATAGLQLLKSWKLDERSKGLEIFKGLFVDGGEEGVAAAIQAIGRTGNERFAHFVAPYLEAPDPEIRENALAAIDRLVNEDSARLLPALLEVIRGGDSERRILAMDAIARIRDTNSIPSFLSLAETFTGKERRKALEVVESVGLRGVPMAVSVLRSPTYSFRGRIIAARALADLSFPQYDDIYPGLIPPVVELAYRSLFRYEKLSGIGVGCPGFEVLRQLFLDGRLMVVEFILELLSIGGRLPDFELINASLRSGNAKERGNAIETIEQGISQELFRTLLPLIDSRPLEDRIAFYVEQFEPAEIGPEDILQDALNGQFTTGCIAAAQAIWELDPPDKIGILRKRLSEFDAPEFRSMAFSLLGVEEDGLNLVERIHHLMGTRLFDSFGVSPIKWVAKQSDEVRFAEGEVIFERGEPTEALYYLIGGRVRAGGATAREVGPGEIFGEGCLFGEDRPENAVSETAHVLRIGREAVFECVEVFPETALLLLEFSKRHRRR